MTDASRTSEELATPKTDAVALKSGQFLPGEVVVPADFARAQERRIAELEPVMNEALDLLLAMYDAYEDGAACYEDPEEFTGYLGNALNLEGSIDQRIVDLLNKHRPVNKDAQA